MGGECASARSRRKRSRRRQPPPPPLPQASTDGTRWVADAAGECAPQRPPRLPRLCRRLARSSSSPLPRPARRHTEPRPPWRRSGVLEWARRYSRFVFSVTLLSFLRDSLNFISQSCYGDVFGALLFECFMYIYSILYLIDAIYFLIALGIVMMETKTENSYLEKIGSTRRKKFFQNYCSSSSSLNIW